MLRAKGPPSRWKAWLVGFLVEGAFTGKLTTCTVDHPQTQTRARSMDAAAPRHYFVQFGVAWLGLCVADALLRRTATRARWEWVHALSNAATTLFALPGVYAALTDPVHAADPRVHPSDATTFWGPGAPFALIVIAAAHVHHAAFFGLNAHDVFHHLVFALTLSLVPLFVVETGALRMLTAFAISGLPGGVQYVAVALYKDGVLEHRAMKRLTAALNLWVRAPLLVFDTTLQYVGYVAATNPEALGFHLLIGGLKAFNALYYLDLSIRSHERALAPRASAPARRPRAPYSRGHVN